MNKIFGLRIVFTVVNRHQSKKIIKMYERLGANYHLVFYGKGTATKEIYDYLGLSGVEKDIIISIVSLDIASILLQSLKEEMQFEEKGKGIAWTVPVDSIGGKNMLDEVIAMTKEE